MRMSNPLLRGNAKMEEQKSGLKSLSVERCPECGASLLVRDQEGAEVVCTNCGFVVVTKLTDRRPEWRAFTLEQRAKRTRVGAPYTFMIHDKGLSTRIDWRDINSLPSEKRAQLYRLRRWQRRTRVSSHERSLASALSKMHRMADALKLPKNILETASLIYRKAVKKDLIRGKSIEGMAAAAIYLACRRCGLVRTLEELSHVSSVNKFEVARNYRFLVQKLNYFVPPVKPSQHITRLCNELAIHGKTEETAYKILKTAGKLRLTSGRGAKGVAAAACYVASKIFGDYRTQREVAEAADITEVTVRNRYREIMKKISITVTL